jgi:DNA-binding winged helix-turn-helix (wHTH) protein
MLERITIQSPAKRTHSDTGDIGSFIDSDVRALTSGLDQSANAILVLLHKRAGSCVSKDELLEAGWPDRIVHENSLAKAIGRIRQVLVDDGAFTLKAVYGHGYRLDRVGEPVEEGSADSGALSAAARRSRAWGMLIALGLTALIALAAIILLTSGKPVTHAKNTEADALLAFLSEDLILPTDPYAPVAANPALRDVVERTAESMDERFAGQPGALVALNLLVARAFSGWGEYDRAVNHLTSARLNAQALGADEMAERLVEIDALTCQQMRLAGQIKLAEQTCAEAVRQGAKLESPHRFLALVNLGKLQFEVGHYPEAAASLDQILNNQEDLNAEMHADALWFRALALRKLARFDEAERDFIAHLAQREAMHGKDHPLTAWAHSDYGDFLAYIGDYDRARVELAAAQQIFDRRLGADHVESLSPAYSLALIHLNEGQGAEAEAILAPMLALYSAKLGRDHFWTAYVMTELALAQAMQGKNEEARQLLREVRASAASEIYDRPAKAAWFHLRWARGMAEIGDEATARDELRRARSGIAKGFKGDHPWQARADCIAARIEQRAGDLQAARNAKASCEARLAASKAPGTYPVHADLARLEVARTAPATRP